MSVADRTDRRDDLEREVEELRLRLSEAEQTLDAIRSGEVDSFVVESPDGMRVYALEGTTNSYRVLIEAMNEGAATVSEGGVVLYCNSRFARMLEWPLEKVMGSALHDHLPERFRETIDALLRGADESERRDEVCLVTANGEEVPTYISVNAIEDQGRKLLCLTATDLRAQKRSEEVLRAERLARSVLEQAVEAIVVCDDRGRITRASRAAVELCGRNPLLSPFDEVFPMQFTEGRHAGERGLAASALAGQIFRATPASLRRADGEATHLLVSAAPLLGVENVPLGCVITMTDMTESRMAEQSLRDADRRKNQFLAVLSHELRNPLAPIKNSLYILHRAPPGGDQARRAQEVLDRQVQQLSRLVDDLLDATRIASNKVELRRDRIDLNEIVRRTVEDYRSLFDKSGLRLESVYAPEPVFVLADSARLAQVLGNLLHNAAKFTGPGGVTTVTVLASDERGHPEIQVCDTGAGIHPDMLQRLFEPFAQADRTLDRSKGGLGLGLSLAKGLVEAHGGEIEAQSDGPGCGARFTVRLPPAASPALALASSGTPRVTLSRRVLVIDDNADAAESLRDALEFGSHVVEVAYDGFEGIAKARTFRPEVVLCDIGLPRMDGYQVARALRDEPTLKNAYLIALSGYALPEDRARAKSAGFDHHIPKPPSLDKIELLLANLDA